MTAAIALVVATCLLPCSDVWAGEWPQIQHDSKKTGASFTEQLQQLAPKFDLGLRAPGTGTVFNMATAVVVGDTVFVGTTDGVALAIARSGGIEKWRVQTGGAVRGSTAVANGLAFFPSDDGVLRALDISSGGTEVWRVDAGSPITGSPMFLTAGAELRVFFATTGGMLYCVKAADGTLVWSASTSGAVWGSPSYNESRNRVYIGSYDANVYAFDVLTGTRGWVTGLAGITLGPIRGSVAVLGDSLYVPTVGNGLFALQDNGGTVTQKWHTFTGTHTGSVAVAPSSGLASATIYVADDPGRLLAVEDRGASGQVVWTRTGLGGRIAGSPVVAGGLVFVASDDGRIRGFSAPDGTSVLEASATAAIGSSLAVSQGSIFVCDATDRLYRFGNLLDPPLNLTAAEQGVSDVGLSWSPSLIPPMDTPASGYRVFRSRLPDQGFAPIAFVNGVGPGGITVSVYVDMSLTATGTYYYAITVLHDVGPAPGLEKSSFSNIASASVIVPLVVGPPQIVNFGARAGDGIANLSWGLQAGANRVSRVWLFARDGSGPLVFSRTLTATATFLQDRRVENQVGYGYALQAVDETDLAGPRTAELTVTPYTVDWPMFQRDALHEAEEPSLQLSPPLEEHWRIRMPDSGGQAFSGYQSGIVVGGTLYITSIPGDVRAYNAVTGATLWTAVGPFGPASSPAYYDGRLYVTHSQGLTVYRADTGAVAWSLPGSQNGVYGFNDAGYGQESSPIIYKGVLFAGVIKDNQFQVVAIDIDLNSPTYQTVLWSRGFGFTFVKASPGAGHGRVYMVSGDGLIRAMNPFTGATEWEAFLGAYVTTTESVNLSVFPPVVLIAHENGNLYAFDADSGSFRWSQYVRSRFTSPAVSGATIFVASFDVNTVYAVNAISGNVVWVGNTFTITGQPIFQAGPIVAGNHVQLYTTNSQFFTLDKATGARLDILNLSNVNPNTAHLSGESGHIYIPSFDGYLVAMTSVIPAPLGLSALPGIQSVRLSWTPAVPNGFPASGYLVYRSTDASFAGPVVLSVAGAATAATTDNTVTPGTVYFYRLAAVDNRGIVGRAAGPVSARPFFVPNIVAQVTGPSYGELRCLNISPTITVTGTAMSANFASYELELVENGTPTATLVRTTPVSAGSLGVLAPTAYGQPVLRLTVFDASGQRVTATVAVDASTTGLASTVSWPVDQTVISSACDLGPFTLTITGLATGTHFVDYTLSVAAQSASLTILSTFTSTTAVDTDGRLGTITMPGCGDYVATLVSRDACGRTRAAVINLTLQGTNDFFVGISFFSVQGKGSGEHLHPQDVAIDLKDYIWIADTGNKRVQKLTADGRVLLELGQVGSGTSMVAFSSPVALAVDGGNRVLVLDRQSARILRLDGGGKLVDSIGGPALGSYQFQQPDGVGVDRATGEIVVADTANNRVVRLTPSGGPSGLLPGDPSLLHPSGAQPDARTSGLIAVADSGNNRVELLNSGNIGATVFGTVGTLPGQFSFPYEALVTFAGQLFVSEVNNNRLSYFYLTGTTPRLITLLPPVGFSGTLFNAPHGLAVNTDNSVLYVADTGNNRIVAIRIRRTTTDFIAPDALIASPVSGTTVSGSVTVTGVAADAHFGSYVLEFGAGTNPPMYTPIALSSTPVWDGTLGLWNTSVLVPGTYTLRLTVTDASSNVSVVTSTFQVAAPAGPLLASASALPSSFMPDRSGTTLRYQLTEPASVQVFVLGAEDNAAVWSSERLAAGAFGGQVGVNLLDWNGRDSHDQPVQPGRYIALIGASLGNRTDRRWVTLEALISPELLSGRLGGGGGSGSSSGPVRDVNPGSGSSGRSGPPGSAGAVSSEPHDNGWHNGNNPNGFAVDHDDKSNGQGNNHH